MQPVKLIAVNARGDTVSSSHDDREIQLASSAAKLSSMLERVRGTRCDIVLCCVSPLHLSHFVANDLRGAFGAALRHHACLQVRQGGAVCDETQRKTQCACAYSRLFHRDIVPPSALPPLVLLNPLDTSRTVYAPGEEFRFYLTLLGEAVDSQALLIETIERMARHGWGNGQREAVAKHNTPAELHGRAGSGRCVVQKVTEQAIDLTSWQKAAPAFGLPECGSLNASLPEQIDAAPEQSMLGITFRHPVYLRKNPRVLTFRHLWDALTSRIELFDLPVAYIKETTPEIIAAQLSENPLEAREQLQRWREERWYRSATLRQRREFINSLTDTQRNMLRVLVRDGASKAEIARQCHWELKTVRNNFTQIKNKYRKFLAARSEVLDVDEVRLVAHFQSLFLEAGQ